jgi:hypothetical protein
VAKPNFFSALLNTLFTPKQSKEFAKFMDFIQQQGVERTSRFDDFKFEKIADNWDALPASVRDYTPTDTDPSNIEGNIVANLGLHSENKRLPGGYHLSAEKVGHVYVHHDVADPLQHQTLEHMATEVAPDLIRNGDKKVLDNINPKDWDN